MDDRSDKTAAHTQPDPRKDQSRKNSPDNADNDVADQSESVTLNKLSR